MPPNAVGGALFTPVVIRRHSIKHCLHESMGLFGGESEGQMAKDTHATGSHLAEFLAKWADGAYSR